MIVIRMSAVRIVILSEASPVGTTGLAESKDPCSDGCSRGAAGSSLPGLSLLGSGALQSAGEQATGLSR
jgi:hypothetical protein